MADEGIELQTVLEAPQIAAIFHDSLFGANKRVQFENIVADTGPFSQFDARPDFCAVAFVIGKVNPINNFALQIYVYDEGDCREVQLVIVGSSTLGRAWHGAKNSYSKAVGRKQAELVIGELRRADPKLKKR